MALIDAASLSILFGAVLVLAGILSSLVAMRFGAPLLLVFLVLGMLAGEAGPVGVRFDDVELAYLVGSIALALILFDGGLRTRFATFRSVIAPALTLATIGVIMTAAFTAPVAVWMMGLGWKQALLVGAVAASTDAAAVMFLLRARGLRLRPRVAATLEIESGTNDPFAIFLTLVLVELLATGDRPWPEIAVDLAGQGVGGAAIGLIGGRLTVLALNRLALAQGLHAPFVTSMALGLFGLAQSVHASGFLAVYLAGLFVGNRPTRAHGQLIVFLDAITWLAQIVMFVLLGLLASPTQLVRYAQPAMIVAATLMLLARPLSVFLCLTPFEFSWREKTFISWVGLRGAVGIFLASIPLLVKLPGAPFYFNVAFVVVLVSLLIQGWTLAPAARLLRIALPRAEPAPRRVELDLPGQIEQELVGYHVQANNPYLRRRIVPPWAKLMLVVRDEAVFTASEAGAIRQGDYVYFLAPPQKAQALDRFFVEMPPPLVPDPRLLGDFFVGGEVMLGGLGEIYGVDIPTEERGIALSDYFADNLGHPPEVGDVLPLGPIRLIANKVTEGVVTVVGLRLAEEEPPADESKTARLRRHLQVAARRAVAKE
jgi:cell volume regulation protein A